MRIHTIIANDSPDREIELHIDKFFQFIIVGDIVNGECDITIYNSISFHYKKDTENPRLIVKFNVNDDENVKIEHLDMSHFYREERVIKQFWGSDSRFSSSYRELINRVNRDQCLDNKKVETLNTSFCNSGDIDGAIFITENKKHIDDIIISPCSIKKPNSDVILYDTFSGLDDDLKNIASNGYWFKSTFKHKIENNHQGFKVKVNIDLKDANFSSSDFKLYIQTKKSFDVKQDNSSIDGKTVSIEKVYSQNSLKYFKEWEDLGIYKSSLFRLSNSKDVDNQIAEKIKNLSSSIQFEDIFASRHREIKILVFSIILSLISSIGLDATRQNTERFESLFPSYLNLSLDFLWILACISLATKFLFFNQSIIKARTILLISFPSAAWFLSYFMFEIDIKRYTCQDISYGDSLLCLSYIQEKLFIFDLFITGVIIFLLCCNNFKVLSEYNIKIPDKFMTKIFGK
ncbi:TPA: hypothetical protein ACF5B0_002848 [Vibrio parahaemolyticus]|uniref:hypothetical protein n=1 Tax=Vibrio harveyi group TaxID=717610 RepID=UPI001124CB2D|nr:MULTISPECIES: hypothetical protein [Vibrio harveyi group]ELA9409679.1 hypothetical protein [Vibrio parahaemolyticus]ELA9436814.1 hypothetical protein [Vibrio parahaemolyticus]TOG30126.1 hypothetical protein CGJ04_13695 [Vibrio parahaemolyticus]UPR39210.1 hypothetical protein H9K57_01795 [Vibrio parahaemolyticus]HCG7306853.1 hypothetical protein [Vibrio parahaemolyticus]